LLVAAVVLPAAGIVRADTVAVDGDTVAVNVQPVTAFGNVCANTSTTKSIEMFLTASQGGANTFRGGSAITVTTSVGPLAGLGTGTLTASGPAGFAPPANWASLPNLTTVSMGFGQVTLNAGSTPGQVTWNVLFTASGNQSSGPAPGGPLSRSAPLAVNGTVVICDTTAPTINVPTPITAEATGPGGAAVSFTVTADDANPLHPTVTCSHTSGSVFPIGTTTVNCSATDAAGNTGTGSFTVTIQDTTPPTIAGTPANIVAEAINGAGATVTYTDPTATDLVDGPRSVVCTPPSGATFPLGTTTVQCTSSDTRGNTATTQFSVTVHDTTAPVLVVPSPLEVEATGPNGAIATYEASASDTVSGAITPSCDPPSGSTFPLGTTNVTCSATDGAGNTASANFDVTVEDTTAPTVSVPASFTVAALDHTGAPVTFTSSALDAVSGALATSCTPGSGSIFPLGATLVTCTATDAAGNVGSASFNITVTDQTAPALSLPADVLEEATGPGGNNVSFTATAVDNVDGPVTVICSALSGDQFPVGVTTVNCTAQDVAGNLAQGSFSVTITDTTAPVIQVPDTQVIEATGPAGAVVTFTVTATDIVDVTVTPTCTPASGSVFPITTTTVSCIATDAAGNESSATFDVVVQDTTVPDIVGTPSDMLIEATGPNGAMVSFTNPTATDIVDGPVAVSCVPPSDSVFPLGEPTLVVCSATDAHGNTASSDFLITVQDTTAPTLSLPANITAEATGPGGAVVTFSASASDIVDGEVAVTCVPPSGTEFPLDQTSVGCSATDAHGNTGSGDFLVTVVDTTPPLLTVPADITAEATGPDGAAVTYTATAFDIVDEDVIPVCVPASGSVFGLGTTTVDCTATDERGNSSSASFLVFVQDTTAPALTLPDNMTAEATSAAGAAVSFAATAVDIVDGPVMVTCSPPSGTVFALGTTQVNCSTTDAAGNTGSGSFTVTVEDTTPPAVSVPGDIVAEATGPLGAAVSFITSAVDIVDGSLTPSCTPSSGSTFAIDSTTVTCTATDVHGNTGSAQFTVTVQDTTGPAIAGTPTDIDAEATTSAGAEVTYSSPTAFDLVDGVVPVDCAPVSGSIFPLDQTTTVNCSAFDTRGNHTSSSFGVFVGDRTAPVLTLPSDFSVEATGPTGAVVTFTATSDDLVDGTAAAQCVPPTGSTLPIGSHTINCTATDAHDNTSSGSFTATVVDTTAPSVLVPANIVVEATGPSGAVVTFSASASDIVDGSVAVTCTPASGSTFAIATTTVTCSATDAHGNTGSASFDVAVQDTTAPVINVPANITVDPTGISGAPVSWGTVNAVDIVDGTSAATCLPPSGSTFGFGTTTVTCTKTDAHGNTGTGTFTVTVRSLGLTGFYQPVDMNGVWNTVKGGSTVPLKFEIFAGSTELTTVAAVASFTQQHVVCGGAALEDAIEVTSTGGTTLRYDGSGGQFIQNWQTPKQPGACYKVTMRATDGSTLVANFKLK
jgi:hypothetical protein